MEKDFITQNQTLLNCYRHARFSVCIAKDEDEESWEADLHC